MFYKILTICLFSICFRNFSLAQATNTAPGTVTIWELGDPDRLNPVTSTSAAARYIQSGIFSRLLEYDPTTMQLTNQLAVALPEIKLLDEGIYTGGMSLTFEIKEEAVWDDGSPVTAYDYIFTIKAIKNPLVNAGSLRPYYEFIDDIKVDDSNNKRFTVYSKERYFLAEESAGEMPILPGHIYDAEGLMKKFEFKDLKMSDFTALSNNSDIKRFAELFNDYKFDRETIVGSNAYRFVEWSTGQHIILERKKDYWGDKEDENSYKYPKKIIYKIVSDQNTALALAKNGALDVLRGVAPESFIETKQNQDITDKFNFFTSNQFAYYYIGINTKSPKLSDKRVRRALAHLIDKAEINETLFNGMAINTNGPVSPQKSYYNKDLKEITHDLVLAKKLLAEAGWKDSNKNGILDKKIDGKLVELSLTYKFNHNEIRKNIGILLKEEAKKVGINIELEMLEWTVFLDQTKRREFDLMCSAWSHGPGLDDMKQIWHTESDTRNGSNRTGFGNKESDKLIDEIRSTLDEETRNKLYMRLQEIIYEEQPYIFLCAPLERIVISKRIKNPVVSALRPGYQEMYFNLSKD